MNEIALVVAASRNGVIGREGDLPWRIPSDLRRFKAITMGKPVIMGRKTWDSLPRKPLPGRQNIVISRKDMVLDGAAVAGDPDAAVALARRSHTGEICVIGGGEIYRQFLPMASRIYLTEVDADVQGDTYFEALDPDEWHEVSRVAPDREAGDSANYILRVLERRGKAFKP